MHRFRFFTVVLAIALTASLVWAQNVVKPNKSKIFDPSSPHGSMTMGDGNGCTVCHAPHNGSVVTLGESGNQATGKLLLWAQAFTTQTFGTYSSLTIQNTPTEIGGSTPANTEPRVYSFLCMSCHDGVTSPTLVSATNMHAIGNPTNSYGLSNDHPVNMNFDPTKNAGLNTVSAVQGAGVWLFGGSNTVQCASCHDPHDHTYDNYLRIDNSTQSKLCTTCHL
jgi:predicted CXXCH cytochrome family protein